MSDTKNKRDKRTETPADSSSEDDTLVAQNTRSKKTASTVFKPIRPLRKRNKIINIQDSAPTDTTSKPKKTFDTSLDTNIIKIFTRPTDIIIEPEKISKSTTDTITPPRKITKEMSSSSKTAPPNNMDVDSTLPPPPSKKALGKKKENVDNPEYLRTSRPPQFPVFIDANLINKKQNWEKAQVLDQLFIADQNFNGARTTFYRGRKIIVAYFDTEEARTNACKIDLPYTDKKRVTPFSKEDIDAEITTDRNKEKNRSIRATGIPKSYDSATIKTIFGKYGTITRFSYVQGDKSHTAYIVYDDPKIIDQFRKTWFMFIKKDMIRVTPLDLSDADVKLRSAHCIKLTGLPLYTYSKDLQEIATQINAKLCIVPHSGDERPATHAFLYFETEDQLNNALTSRDLAHGGNPLFFVPTAVKACHNCGDPNHLIKDCRRQKIRYPPIPPPRDPPRFSSDNPYASWDDEMDDYYTYGPDIYGTYESQQPPNVRNHPPSYADMVSNKGPNGNGIDSSQHNPRNSGRTYRQPSRSSVPPQQPI